MREALLALFDRIYPITIGFLIPGMVVLFALSTVSATVQTWFTGAATGPTFVGLLFVMFAALTLGLVVSSIRYCVFEVIPVPWRGCLVEQGPQFDHTKRKDCEAAYQDIRLNHYAYYLNSANLSVALPIGVWIWKAGSNPAPTWSLFLTAIVLTTIATVALAAAGCSAVRRYNEKRAILLGVIGRIPA